MKRKQRTAPLLRAPAAKDDLHTIICPICFHHFPSSEIEIHASGCQGSLKDSMQKNNKGGNNIKGSRKSLEVQAPQMHHCQARNVPGFFVFPGFVTGEEETSLIERVESEGEWQNWKVRYSKAFGPRWDARTRTYRFDRKPTPLPGYAAGLLERIRSCAANKDGRAEGGGGGAGPARASPTGGRPGNNRPGPALPAGLGSFRPNQLAVNKYDGKAGHHILPHNDNENALLGPFIVGIALGAGCRMTFSDPLNSSYKADVPIPRRALYVLGGRAHRELRHAIFARSIDGTRISLTFREVKPSLVSEIQRPSQKNAAVNRAVHLRRMCSENP